MDALVFLLCSALGALGGCVIEQMLFYGPVSPASIPFLLLMLSFVAFAIVLFFFAFLK